MVVSTNNEKEPLIRFRVKPLRKSAWARVGKIWRDMDTKYYRGNDEPLYYSIEEFRTDYPDVEPKPWREADAGDWVLTDEGGVCHLVKKGEYTVSKTPRTIVSTITGTYCVEGKVPMDNVIKKRPDQFVSITGEEKQFVGVQRRLLRDELSRGDRLFAHYVAQNGLGEMEINEDVLMDCYRKAFPRSKSEDYIKLQSRILFNTQRVQKVLKQEVIEGLNAKDVTFGQVVDWMKDLINNDKITDKGSIVVPASVKGDMIKEFLHLLGAKTEVKQITEKSWWADGQIGEGEMKKVAKIGQKEKTTENKTEIGKQI